MANIKFGTGKKFGVHWKFGTTEADNPSLWGIYGKQDGPTTAFTGDTGPITPTYSPESPYVPPYS